jgi:hypothetical protein
VEHEVLTVDGSCDYAGGFRTARRNLSPNLSSRNDSTYCCNYERPSSNVRLSFLFPAGFYLPLSLIFRRFQVFNTLALILPSSGLDSLRQHGIPCRSRVALIALGAPVYG